MLRCTQTQIEPTTASQTKTLGSIAVIGTMSIFLAPYVPGVNAVVLALVIGIVVANSRLGDADDRVASFMLKRVLKATVIALGAGINLSIVTRIGGQALATTALSVVVALVAARVVGTKLGLTSRSAVLIGVGTAICGASAIAAVAPVIRAKKEEIGVALATIFSFNALALVLYPLVGAFLGMNQTAFGTWAGIGVHDTATSVATGFAFGAEAGEVATLVKLTRTLFLIPLILIIAIRETRGPDATRQGIRAIGQSFPWFVAGFVTLAVANTLGLLGQTGDLINDIAKLAIVFVVAVVGLTLRVSRVSAIGRPLFITGFISSFAVGAVALGALGALGIG